MTKPTGGLNRGAGAVATIRAAVDGTIAPLLARLGESALVALGDGRVFVDKRRATVADERIHAGQDVFVYPPRVADDGAHVLAERDGVLAMYKPPAMATLPDQRGIERTLLGAVERLTGRAADTWHATSRLDVGVSGLVLFAGTDEAKRRLRAARERGAYVRRYVAVAARVPDPDHGTWALAIGGGKDKRHRAVGGARAAPAVTLFATVARAGSLGSDGSGASVLAGAAQGALDRAALLAVTPRTGRTHQIRVHAAHAGAPLLGDAVYGGPVRLVSARGAVTALPRIALHAAWVNVPDARGEPWRVDAPVPDDLYDLWGVLGGVRSSFDEAVTVDVGSASNVR